MAAHRWLLIGALPLLVFIAACVPESDIEQAAGDRPGEEAAELTPIPEEELPDLPDVDVRVQSVSVQHGAGEAVAEISVTAGSSADLDLADTARVEWSDGEVVDALPIDGESVVIESRRNDPDGVLEPVRLILSDISWQVGTDPEAEIDRDAIQTEWGSFPVLEIESVNRPPGWKLRYQAAGQRWVSAVRAYENRRARDARSEDLTFDDDFRPVTAALRFDHEVEDLEAALPLPAEVDVRVAVPEIELDL